MLKSLPFFTKDMNLKVGMSKVKNIIGSYYRFRPEKTWIYAKFMPNDIFTQMSR